MKLLKILLLLFAMSMLQNCSSGESATKNFSTNDLMVSDRVEDVMEYLFDGFEKMSDTEKEVYIRNFNKKKFGQKIDNLRVDGKKLPHGIIRYMMEEAGNLSLEEIYKIYGIFFIYVLEKDKKVFEFESKDLISYQHMKYYIDDKIHKNIIYQ